MDIADVVRVALVAAVTAAAQPVPANLSALLARAGVDGRVAAWCGGRFRPGSPDAFAVAMTSAAGGGRYVVIEADASSKDLAPFTAGAQLSCYTRAEAQRLDRTIRRSETIHGGVAPRWNTTTVCGFIENTIAVCCQFDPAQRVFVTIGGWMT